MGCIIRLGFLVILVFVKLLFIGVWCFVGYLFDVRILVFVLMNYLLVKVGVL